MPNFNTTPEPYQIRRWLFIGVAALVVIAIIVLLSNFAVLRAVKITPDPAPNAGGDVLQTFTIQYSRGLSPKTADKVTVSPKIEGTATVEGSTLRFVPTETFTIGTEYTITVDPVGSFGDPGQQTKFTFTPDHVAKQDVPLDLASSLPYGTTQFSIIYTMNPDNTLNIFVRLNAPVGDPRLKQYKTAALTYIKDHHEGTLDGLNILIDPDPDLEGADQSEGHEDISGPTGEGGGQ